MVANMTPALEPAPTAWRKLRRDTPEVLFSMTTVPTSRSKGLTAAEPGLESGRRRQHRFGRYGGQVTVAGLHRFYAIARSNHVVSVLPNIPAFSQDELGIDHAAVPDATRHGHPTETPRR
jgi:hypothetical protein